MRKYNIRVNSHSALDDLLNGDNDALMSCFCWSDTPQGGLYWSEIYTDNRSITEQDKVFLEILRRFPPREEKIIYLSTKALSFLTSQ